MAKRPARPKDSAALAKLVVQIASGEKPNDPFPFVAESVSRGGNARAAALTPARRKAIAKKAAAARWKKKR